MYALTDKNSPHARHNCFVLTKFREWKENHESWIIVTKHARIMNLCTLGIMTKRDSEKSPTKYTHKLVAFRSRECGIWRFRESIFQNFFPGEVCTRTPVYNSCIRGCQSACFSSNLLQNLVRLIYIFSFKRTPYLDKTNDDTEFV